ncbi:type IV toxin-antitoxin system AbiEi family antitoxin domain-containing protein [Nocardia sp. NPDC051750]|uniref:type IV toxin-antitoxin system AbiEi family antitoxin domain-containing protein n=1 Tax=Nocardia sp. NPDC051750 TaxID=3364325 RepID=UPI003789991B
MADGQLHELADLAETQWGLFTTAQATRLFGLHHLTLLRYTEDGVLLRIRHGVYRLPDAAPHPIGSVLDEIHAEWLALEPRRTVAERIYDTVPFGVVSHHTAAWLQNLGNLTASPGDRHHFTLHRRRRRPGVAFHAAELAATDWHFIDHMPVTRPLRTVADLACCGTAAADIAGAAYTVLQHGDAAPDALAAALAPHEHPRCLRSGDAVRRFEKLSRSASAGIVAPSSPGRPSSL